MTRLWALLRMELVLQLRQPAALALLVGLPLLLGPGALWAGATWDSQAKEASTGDPGDDEILRIAASEDFARWVVPDDHLDIVAEGTVTDDSTLDDGEVWAALTRDGRTFTLRRDHQLARARQARNRVREVLGRQGRAERDEELRLAGLEPDEEVWQLLLVPHAGDATSGGRDLGKVLPPLLMFTLLLGAVYTAFDVITGDKERSTSETLLTTGAHRSRVLAAKATVVAGAAVLAGTAWLAGVVLAHASGLLAGNEALDHALSALSPGTVALVEGLVVLLGLQVAGAAIGVASWVDDYRSGSMVAGPVLLVLLAPSGLPSIDTLELTWWVALVPVGNVSVAFRDVLAGQLHVAAGVAVVAIALVQALAAFAAGHRLLAREETFTGRADADARRGMGRFGPDAAMTFVAAMLVYWFLGTLAQRVHLVGGHLFSQATFAVTAVGAVAFFGAPRSRLRLGAPRPLDLLWCALAALCTPIVAAAWFVLQEQLLPGGLSFGEQFAEGLGAVGDNVALILLLFAVLPGLCEELVFRGSLLGLADRDLPAVPRVLVVAAGFALMHLSVYRLGPTFFVGVVAGAVVLRSGSLWCGVVLHTIHNAVSLMLPRLVDGQTRDLSPADVAVAGVLAAVVAGLVALVGRGRSE